MVKEMTNKKLQAELFFLTPLCLLHYSRNSSHLEILKDNGTIQRHLYFAIVVGLVRS
jgi:hypothetical protein